MTTHVQPRPTRVLVSRTAPAAPSLEPSRTASRRIWQALASFGARRAAGEMTRLAALHDEHRPALAAVLRAAAARRPG